MTNKQRIALFSLLEDAYSENTFRKIYTKEDYYITIDSEGEINFLSRTTGCHKFSKEIVAILDEILLEEAKANAYKLQEKGNLMKSFISEVE